MFTGTPSSSSVTLSFELGEFLEIMEYLPNFTVTVLSDGRDDVLKLSEISIPRI